MGFNLLATYPSGKSASVTASYNRASVSFLTASKVSVLSVTTISDRTAAATGVCRDLREESMRVYSIEQVQPRTDFIASRWRFEWMGYAGRF